MRTFLAGLFIAVMVFMLLFSSGTSVDAIPNTPTSTPVTSYLNGTYAVIARCDLSGGFIHYAANMLVPSGIAAGVEWSAYWVPTSLGRFIDGYRLVGSGTGTFWGNFYWTLDPAVSSRYFQYYPLEFWIHFHLVQYVGGSIGGTKILLDSTSVYVLCQPSGVNNRADILN